MSKGKSERGKTKLQVTSVTCNQLLFVVCRCCCCCCICQSPVVSRHSLISPLAIITFHLTFHCKMSQMPWLLSQVQLQLLQLLPSLKCDPLSMLHFAPNTKLQLFNPRNPHPHPQFTIHNSRSSINAPAAMRIKHEMDKKITS